MGLASPDSLVANYALLPTRLVGPVALWLPRLELFCALALLAGLLMAPFAVVAGALLVAFSLAAGANLARGRRIDCGCHSSVAPKAIGWRLIATDLALAGMSVAAALINPHVLVLYALGSPAHASSLSSMDGLAILALAGAAVATELVISTWVGFRSAASSFRNRTSREVVT